MVPLISGNSQLRMKTRRTPISKVLLGEMDKAIASRLFGLVRLHLTSRVVLCTLGFRVGSLGLKA